MKQRRGQKDVGPVREGVRRPARRWKGLIVATAIIIPMVAGTEVAHADTPAEIICYQSGVVCVFLNINRNGPSSSGVWARTVGSSSSYDTALISFSYSTGSYWKSEASSATNYRTTRHRFFENTSYGGGETCAAANGGYTNTLARNRLYSMAAG